MKSIGEFAKNNNVTIRALHHYEKLELLIPYKVDESTGYRYYKENQNETLQFVLALKKLGFSLNEIKPLLLNSNDKDLLLRNLQAKKAQAIMQKNSAEANYNLLNNIITNYERTTLTFMEILKMSIEKKETKKNEDNIFRHLVNTAFDEHKSDGRPLFAMTLDIDKFGDINSRFGRAVGDEILESVYNSIVQTQSEMNIKNVEHYALVERAGGDEFKIIVKDNKSNAEKLAQKIIENIKSADYSYLADDLHITATIGIAGINSAKSAFEFMHSADTAMMDAKAKKKGSYLFF